MPAQKGSRASKPPILADLNSSLTSLSAGGAAKPTTQADASRIQSSQVRILQ